MCSLGKVGIAATLLAVAGSADAIEYTYDDLNRLIGVAYDNGTTIAYSYDAAGNRIGRVVTEDNDSDGIPYSGGANLCTGGQTTGCEDNCSLLANAEQADPDLDAQGNACDVDDDGDALLDIYETNTGSYVSPTNAGTDPLNFDTDGDGYSDGAEIAAGSDPTNASSTPQRVPGLSLGALAALGAFLLGTAYAALVARQRRVA